MIRLQRVGRKNDPSFRVVLVDSHRAAKTGSVIETLGNYDARKGEPSFNKERVKHWLSVGAKPSDTVHNLFLSAKLIEGKKINVLPKKSPPKKEEAVSSLDEAPSEGKKEGKKEAIAEAAPAKETDSAEEKSTPEGEKGVDLTEKTV